MSAEICKHGHPQTPENARITPKGQRYCRACRRIAEIRYEASHVEQIRARHQAWFESHRERQRATRRRYMAAHPGRYAAWRSVRRGIKLGYLVRLPCIRCGDELSEAHHYLGYAREHYRHVIWLCHTHHMVAHTEEAAA